MKSFRKFSQRKENRDYMNQEESVYELNRIQRYIMQMRPLLKKNALFSDGRQITDSRWSRMQGMK